MSTDTLVNHSDPLAEDACAMRLKDVLNTWRGILEDPSLQDLPYKIETNSFGQIIMSPANRKHTRYQGIIIRHLCALTPDGEVHPECPVATSDGVKAPDVAWISETRSLAEPNPLAFTTAPEVCIEVLSPSNRKQEIENKKTLYFEQGADEVWVCDDTGAMTFFKAAGAVEQSTIFPAFPRQI